ncbi:MAG: hypothetical protein R3F54_21555 [Alphaproteobacteria bacterium]
MCGLIAISGNGASVVMIEDLIGEWEKLESPACAALYPVRISFLANGNYQGSAAVSGTFTLWDVGSYELIKDDELELSTATDAVKSYRFALADDVMSLTDEADCRFTYRRVV